MVIDDQLNILPISSHTLNITALPPKSKVTISFIALSHTPLKGKGEGVRVGGARGTLVVVGLRRSGSTLGIAS